MVDFGGGWGLHTWAGELASHEQNTKELLVAREIGWVRGWGSGPWFQGKTPKSLRKWICQGKKLGYILFNIGSLDL